MTTEGIKDPAESLLRAAGELSLATNKRVRELRTLRRGLSDQVPKLGQAFRLGQQRLVDQDLDYYEELTQLLGENISKEPAVLEVDAGNCEEELARLHEELRRSNSERDQARDDLRQTRQDNEHLEADLNRLREEMRNRPANADLEAQLDQLRRELDEANTRAEQFRDWLDEANRRATGYEADLNRLREEMRNRPANADLEAQLDQLRRELDEANTRAEQFRDWLDEANRRANGLQGQLEAANAEIERLRNATPVVPTRSVRQHLNPRNWTWLQWVLAVVLGLLGLRIGLWTDSFGHAHGAIHDFVATVWTVGLTVLGFGLGGIVGFWVDEWRRNRPHRAQANV